MVKNIESIRKQASMNILQDLILSSDFILNVYQRINIYPREYKFDKMGSKFCLLWSHCSHLTKPLHKDGSFANKHLSRRTNMTQLIVEL